VNADVLDTENVTIFKFDWEFYEKQGFQMKFVSLVRGGNV